MLSTWVNKPYASLTVTESFEGKELVPSSFGFVLMGADLERGTEVLYLDDKCGLYYRGIFDRLDPKRPDTHCTIKYSKDKRTTTAKLVNVFTRELEEEEESSSSSSSSSEEEEEDEEVEVDEGLKAYLLDASPQLITRLFPVVERLGEYGYTTVESLRDVALETWKGFLEEAHPGDIHMCATWAHEIHRRLARPATPPSQPKKKYKKLTTRNPNFKGDAKLADQFKHLVLFHALIQFEMGEGTAWAILDHDVEFSDALQRLEPYFAVDLLAHNRAWWLATCRKGLEACGIIKHGKLVPGGTSTYVCSSELVRELSEMIDECENSL